MTFVPAAQGAGGPLTYDTNVIASLTGPRQALDRVESLLTFPASRTIVIMFLSTDLYFIGGRRCVVRFAHAY